MLQTLVILWILLGVIFWLNHKAPQPFCDKRLRLPQIANSIIFALVSGCISWEQLQRNAEIFPDFIGGFPAMSAMPKSFEYYSFYIAISVFFISFLMLMKLYNSFRSEADIQMVRKTSLYALMIPALLIGQCFISNQFAIIFKYSAISISCGLLVIVAKLRFRKLQQREMSALLLGLYFGIASHFCLKLFCNRITSDINLTIGYWLIWSTALFFAFRKGTWNKFLVLSQCGLPLAFGNLLFPTQILRDQTIFTPGFNNNMNIAVLILILSGYFSLYAAFRKKSGTLSQFIPSLPLTALICLFCAAPEQWPGISFDDYHNGEIVLPWFLFQKFGSQIYVDYIPSRGVVNYIPGFLLWLFKGDDFSYLNSFIKWADLPLYFSALTILRRRSGLLIAAAGCAGMTILTPYIGAGVLFGLLCLILFSSSLWVKKPSLMLALFFISGVAGVFYSLTDTLAVFVAMLPLAIYALYIAWKKERKAAIAVLTGAVGFLILLLLIPLSRNILCGIAEILFLQTDTYTTSHCVPLLERNIKYFNIYYVTLNYSFLLLTVLFGCRLFILPKNNRSMMHYLTSASLVILGIIMIQRAGGRAGCDEMSRVLFVSLQMVIIVLPVWYRDWVKKKLNIWQVLILCLLFGLFGSYTTSIASLESKHKGVLLEPANTCNPAEAGLPHLGSNAELQAEHFQHHKDAKALIDSILPDVENTGGFWDMTNNSAIYAYCGNGIKPPMSYPSYFYLGSPELAEKMKKEIQKSNPVLILIKGKNIEFYEGTIALRCYPLYRYMLDNYRVFGDINGKIWMIRKGCEELLKRSDSVKQDSLDDQNLLSNALDYKKIDGYPISWARTLPSLQKRMTKLASLQFQQLNANTISLYGVSSLGGDFLYLKFNRPVDSRGIIVSWQDSFAGAGQPFIAFWGGNHDFLIPMYNSTNWYLSNSRWNLTVHHEDNRNEPLQLLEATLYKRN